MFFDVLTECETFRIQCTKKMTEDYLVGPLDMKLFREEGIYVHRTEGSLVESHFGFIDEILDLSSGALRALLEILNERTFTRGIQKVKSPLHTAIATTNFNKDRDDELAAVLDRFLFRAKIEKLSRIEDRMKMLQAPTNPNIPTLSFLDVKRVKDAMQKVRISDAVLEVYLRICEGLELTDRTVKKALDVVRASAVMCGRSTALIQDLSVLDVCFTVTNDKTSSQRFASAMGVYAKAFEESLRASQGLVLNCRVNKLKDFSDAAITYADILPAAAEAREALHTFNAINSSGMAASVCEEILNKADRLYKIQQGT